MNQSLKIFMVLGVMWGVGVLVEPTVTANIALHKRIAAAEAAAERSKDEAAKKAGYANSAAQEKALANAKFVQDCMTAYGRMCRDETEAVMVGLRQGFNEGLRKAVTK